MITILLYRQLFPYNLQFFKLDVLYETPSGELAVAPPTYIVSELHNILKAAPEPAEYPVGILTTEHRDTWFQARERLLRGKLYNYEGVLELVEANVT